MWGTALPNNEGGLPLWPGLADQTHKESQKSRLMRAWVSDIENAIEIEQQDSEREAGEEMQYVKIAQVIYCITLQQKEKNKQSISSTSWLKTN